jgi:hypothetical protein
VARLRAHHAGMLRLGLLMTITLTIHNLPEVSLQRSTALMYEKCIVVCVRQCGSLA